MCEGFEDGKITNAGKLPAKYLHKIRDVVRDSFLLAQRDIDDAVRVLPRVR